MPGCSDVYKRQDRTNPFRDGHNAVAGQGLYLFYISDKLFRVKSNFRQVDQMRRAGAHGAGQSGGSGEPSSVAAHNFHNGYRIGVIHVTDVYKRQG